MSSPITQEHLARAKENGIGYTHLHNRYHTLGWDLERAVTEPLRIQRSLYQDYKEICQAHNIRRDTFCRRVKKGMDPMEAATMPKRKEGRPPVS